MNASPLSGSFLGAAAAVLICGCVSSKVEQIREAPQVARVAPGESIVILSRREHGDHETEADFTDCLAAGLSDKTLKIYPEHAFVDALFPWLEPRTAPLSTDALPALLDNPEVAQRIRSTGVRYMIWVDGESQVTDSKGQMSCAVGPGFAGCFGFASWDKQSAYKASVWDIRDRRVVGKASVKATGTSFMPAVIVPIPLIARTQSAACDGLAAQLGELLTPANDATATATAGLPASVPDSTVQASRVREK